MFPSASTLSPRFGFKIALVCLLCWLGLLPPANAQSVLFETFIFETQFTKENGNGDPIQFFSDGDSSYFGLHNGIFGFFGGDPQPTGIGSYADFMDNVLVVESAGTTVDPLPVALVWSDLDITGLRELDLSIWVASLNATTFEASDFLRVEYSVDDGPYFTVWEARANPDGLMTVDTHFDGVGDGGAFDLVTAEKYVATLVDGTSLHVRLSISVDEVGEDFAVDRIEIVGALINEWTIEPEQSTAFFDGANWSLGTVPESLDDAAIRNGGTAASNGATEGDPSSAELASLILGDRSGNGTLSFTGVDFAIGGYLGIGGQDDLTAPNTGIFSGTHGKFTVRDASSLSIGDSMHIGRVWTLGTASVQASGEVTLENLTSVMVNDSLEIGGGKPLAFSTADSEGTLTARDIGTLTIGSDLDICDTTPSGSPGGIAASICTSNVLFDNVAALTVGDDLEIADAVATPYETLVLNATAEFVDVDLLTVEDNFEMASTSATASSPVPGVSQIAGTTRLTRTTARIVDNVEIGDLTLSTETQVDATVSLELIDSTVTTDPGSMGIVGSLSGGADTGETILEAALRLDSSTMTHNGSLSVGFAADAPVGALQAEVVLDRGSKLIVEQLDLGSEGTLELRLDGTANPFDSLDAQLAPLIFDREEHLGTATYSAVTATDATLGGEVVVVFDFLPPEGTHTFDLVTSGSAGALVDTTATLTLLGLDPGFTVNTFGVVTETVDVLRLVISGAPVPLDLTAELSNGVDSVVPGESVVFTAVVSNLGPADDPAALAEATFPAELESCSWKSLASGGATGNGSGSGSLLREMVSLPAGGQIEYTITCHLATDAEGELINEIQIFGSRPDSKTANNIASDTDTILDVADLSITLTDGETTALPGDLRFYTFVVSNAGPRLVNDAVVTDIFPPELTACTWTCAANDPGAGCQTAMGDGNVMETVSLGAGSAATFIAGCSVDPELDPSTLAIVNTVSITPPAGILDLNNTNNMAQDINGGPGAVFFRDGFESGDFNAWSSANP